MAGAEVRTTRVRERRRRELHRVDDREAGHETAFSARQMKPYTGPPPTLGSTVAAGARIIMVPWVQPSRRARPRRDGCSVRRERPCSIVERARIFSLRQPGQEWYDAELSRSEALRQSP